jgi:cytoskeletal protein RodZ
VSLREIADATKISVRFLEALERDRWDVLPGGVFPRSFLKQYADYLGLDTERLVKQLVAIHTEPEAAARPASLGRYVSEHRGNLVVVAIVLCVGLLTLLKFQSSSNVARPRARAAAAPAATAPPAARVASDRLFPPPAAEPPRADRIRLALTARQSSWVAVSVDGQTVVDRILSPGESQTFEAQGEIVLSVGNAGGLSFTVNGQAGIPLGRSGEVRRNIVITPESLSAFLLDRDENPRLAHSG